MKNIPKEPEFTPIYQKDLELLVDAGLELSCLVDYDPTIDRFVVLVEYGEGSTRQVYTKLNKPKSFVDFRKLLKWAKENKIKLLTFSMLVSEFKDD